jgi:hypothetical protein
MYLYIIRIFPLDNKTTTYLYAIRIFFPREQDDGVSIDVYGYNILLLFIYLFIYLFQEWKLYFVKFSLILLIENLIFIVMGIG